MTDYAQLIERLETAEAGSRDLDARVEVAALTGHCWIKLPNDEHRLRKGQVLVKGFREELTAFADAEHVTTSLDAAVSLVELVLPGHEYQLWVDLENKKRFAQVSEAVWDECGDSTLGMSRAGFALALCIALLKAIQARATS